MSKTIGIDLGSTKSVMAFLKNTRPVVLSNRESSDSTPSIVYLDAHSEPIVGEMAQREGERTPQQTVVSVKRLLGRSFDDPAIQEDIRRASYKVTRAAIGECAIELRGRSYTPTEITAFILKSLKEDAENDLGVEFSHAVLTVPVFAGNRQRQAMHEAGRLAGLQDTQLLPESTAAALSYFDGEQQQEPKTLLVYDFGGCSLSITVMLVAAGFFEALGHAGDMHLGGYAFDQMIINWVLDQVRIQHRLELRELPDAAKLLFRLKLEAEKAKMRLSRSQSTQILIPDFTRVGSNLIDIDCELTRPEFERMIQPDIDRSLNLVQAAMRQAQVTQGEIDEILLVGGSTHIPAVRQSMQKLWGDRLLRSLIHPLHCVALGAAIRAGDGVKESENPPLYVDMIPRPIGTRSAEGSFLELIPGDTSYPMAAPVTRVFRTATFGQRVFSLPLYEGGDFPSLNLAGIRIAARPARRHTCGSRHFGRLWTALSPRRLAFQAAPN